MTIRRHSPYAPAPSWRTLLAAGCRAAGSDRAVRQFLAGVQQAANAATGQRTLPMDWDDVRESRDLQRAILLAQTAAQSSDRP